MESFRTEDAVLLRRNWPLVAAYAVLMGVGSFALTLHAATPLAAREITRWALATGLLSFLVALTFDPPRRRTKVTLVADAQGLRVDGVMILPRAEIAASYMKPDPKAVPTVRLLGKGPLRELEIELASSADNDAFLHALSLDPASARVTFLAPSRLLVAGSLHFLAISAWLAAFTMCLAARMPAGFVLLLAFTPLAFVRQRIVVGRDGMHVRWFMRGRFIPYAWVRGVGLDGRVMVIDLRDQAPVRVSFASLRNWDEFKHEGVAVVTRVEEALRAYAHRTQDPNASALLQRGNRTTGEWIEALRELNAEHAASYRTATVPSALLWSVAENAASPHEERAAAVMALRPTLDDVGRRRLRVLASETVEPRVRVVLETAATSVDEDAMVRALEGCVEDSGNGIKRAVRA